MIAIIQSTLNEPCLLLYLLSPLSYLDILFLLCFVVCKAFHRKKRNKSSTGVMTFTVIGTVGGTANLALGFLAIGLTPIGPLAGGFFAANLGAALESG